MNTLFQGIFSSANTSIQVGNFLLCLAVSLIIGIFLAAVSSFKNTHSESFVMTLAILPAVVCVVIMMVNGNVGAGVAVAGAFSLVKFRSAPGTAKEISEIFLAMVTGLITGMGYLGYAILFTVILSAFLFVYSLLGSRKKSVDSREKALHITIPENLNYEGVFDEALKEYTEKYELISVKTTNMGSLFKLTYQITLKGAGREKEFLDKLRCRNGNLEIILSRQDREQQPVL